MRQKGIASLKSIDEELRALRSRMVTQHSATETVQQPVNAQCAKNSGDAVFHGEYGSRVEKYIDEDHVKRCIQRLIRDFARDAEDVNDYKYNLEEEEKAASASQPVLNDPFVFEKRTVGAEATSLPPHIPAPPSSSGGSGSQPHDIYAVTDDLAQPRRWVRTPPTTLVATNRTVSKTPPTKPQPRVEYCLVKYRPACTSMAVSDGRVQFCASCHRVLVVATLLGPDCPHCHRPIADTGDGGDGGTAEDIESEKFKDAVLEWRAARHSTDDQQQPAAALETRSDRNEIPRAAVCTSASFPLGKCVRPRRTYFSHLWQMNIPSQ